MKKFKLIVIHRKQVVDKKFILTIKHGKQVVADNNFK
jgi:hypothetical protein